MRLHPRRAMWALLAVFTTFYALLNLASLGGLDVIHRQVNQLTPSENSPLLGGVGGLLQYDPPKPKKIPSKWFWTRGLQEVHQELFPPKPVSSTTSSTTSPLVYNKSKRNLSVWPSSSRVNRTSVDDRIVAQMAYIPESLRSLGPRRPKLIIWHPSIPTASSGMRRFHADKCPVKHCFITADKGLAPVADAIIFANMIPSADLVRNLYKPPHQVWIQYMLESPANTVSTQHLRNMINWTATYRTDSTIVTPYEKFVPFPNASLIKTDTNFAQGKTKMVAWFVSNCNAGNNRRKFAEELGKHIPVDIYGSCGKFQCARGTDRCSNLLKKDYKFYLAFENSNCRDYITEKFYWNALQNDVVPVVMGATREDYEYAAPPGSFIYADDFETPQDLAEYLIRVASDDNLYNQYFRWRGTGEFVNTFFYCRLCAMLHDDVEPSWYEDFHAWWSKGVCTSKSNKNPYASWRLHRQLSRHSSRGDISKIPLNHTHTENNIMR